MRRKMAPAVVVHTPDYCEMCFVHNEPAELSHDLRILKCLVETCGVAVDRPALVWRNDENVILPQPDILAF
jgi:hypothetical protein